MKIVRLTLSITAIFFLSALFFTNVKAQSGTLFTVNHNGDSGDISLGDGFCSDANGKCTLRAAIEEANVSPQQDAINFSLPTPATIDLTLGELTITSNLYLVGPGARNLTVQRSAAAGTPQFRLFRIQSTVVSFFPSTIRGLTLKNGSTTSDGGAVFVDNGGALQLTDVAISNNSAASGGGIFNAGLLYVTRCLINSNTANGLFGGGIVNINALATSIISNSTLTNNTGSQGGAVYNNGSLLLVNDTFSHNVASDSGSSIMNSSKGTVHVLNTIVGLDVASPTSSLSGTFVSLGNNLVTDARNSSGFANGVNSDQVSDNNAINPLIGNLADNGGQTETRALLQGSPAVNAGNGCILTASCPQPVPQGFRLTSDQRQNSRRFGSGAVDIGAYESQSSVIGISGSLGGFGVRNRLGGVLVILTSAATNEKRYRITNPFGAFAFDDITDRDVYIIERKGKRAGSSALLIFDLDNLPVLLPGVSALELEKEGMRYEFEIKAQP